MEVVVLAWLTVIHITIRYLRTEKDKKRLKKKSSRKSDKGSNASRDDGAIGPDGEFVEFPKYDGSEEPTKAKKAFTMFCIGTRKQVKSSLSKAMRKDKVSTMTYIIHA